MTIPTMGHPASPPRSEMRTPISPSVLFKTLSERQYFPDADLISTATEGETQVALFYSGTDLYSMVFDRDVNGSFVLQEPELLPSEPGSEVLDSGQSVSGDADEPASQQRLRPPATKLTKTGWREEWSNNGARVEAIRWDRRCRRRCKRSPQCSIFQEWTSMKTTSTEISKVVEWPRHAHSQNHGLPTWLLDLDSAFVFPFAESGRTTF